MTAPTHVISGLATAVLIGRLTPFAPDPVNLLTLLLGSIAPDIDGNGVITKPGSILRRFFGRTIAEFLDMVASVIVGFVHLCFSHRGLLHAPLLALALGCLGYLLDAEWLVWFSIGYAVHLLGDAMTHSGIPLAAPFSERRRGFLGIKTGGVAEYAIAVVLLLFTVVCGWTLLPEAVKQTHLQLLESLG